MRKRITIGLGLLVWLWVAYTLFVVGRFGGAVVVDPDTTSRLMGVRNDGEMSSAVALTYHGIAGAALVVVELLVVAGALLLSLRSRGWPRFVAPLILVLWTALWLGNAIWLRSVGWDHRMTLYGLWAAMVIVLAWTAMRWLPRRHSRANTASA